MDQHSTRPTWPRQAVLKAIESKRQIAIIYPGNMSVYVLHVIVFCSWLNVGKDERCLLLWKPTLTASSLPKSSEHARKIECHGNHAHKQKSQVMHLKYINARMHAQVKFRI